MWFFEELGSLVGCLWKAKNYREEDFPEIADQALSELPPHLNVSLWDIVKWAFTTKQLPVQVDLEARFGQPPLTVYNGRDFRIEVLFWTQGVPAVHQHSFSGAFHVMSGSSLHCVCNFERVEQVALRLALGRITVRKAELLQKGDVRKIFAGNEMIHSTFHLDRPSLTVVVRTTNEVDKLPQYVYLPPTIAYDQEGVAPSVQRQSQLLKMLVLSHKRAEYEEILRHAIATEDACAVFHFFLATFPLIEDDEQRHNLLLAASIKHPRLIEMLTPALFQDERREKIISMRQQVSDCDLQFFLALLLNIPERNSILSLIKQRYPSRDAATTVVQWVSELSQAGLLGVQFPDPWILMLQCLLTDRSPQETQEAFEDYYGAQPVAAHRSSLRELSSGLRDSWLLEPLFRN